MHRTLSEFLAMGGYAGFVWSSYAAWVLVIGLNIWFARQALAEARRQALRRLATRESGHAGSEE